MASIKKVVIAGASGFVGSQLIRQLQTAGFELTVLTRSSSKLELPADIAIKSVDYDSVDSLTPALQGQDAVVSVLGPNALVQAQLHLIEAAVRAGVKRFLPSELGSDAVNENVTKLPFFADKARVLAVLKGHADAGKITWTAVCNGVFLDLVIKSNFAFSLKEKSATLYDGGVATFSGTTLESSVKAVTGVLRNPEQTRNRAVYVQSTATSINKLVAMAKKAVGSDGWKETSVAVDDILEEGYRIIKEGQPEVNAGINFIKAVVFSKSNLNHFQQLDNELLGVPQMSDDEVQELVDTAVAELA
ncbi:nmrA-like family protein-like protein [Xylariaceae sp. FL0804]|nr:nmrA-like family protein-like protein [Xylariaceae sp. FL0804]